MVPLIAAANRESKSFGFAKRRAEVLRNIPKMKESYFSTTLIPQNTWEISWESGKLYGPPRMTKSAQVAPGGSALSVLASEVKQQKDEFGGLRMQSIF